MTGSLAPADEVVAHQPFPVLRFLGLAKRGEGVDLPVDLGGESLVAAQRLGGHDAEVGVGLEVEPDLVGDVGEGLLAVAAVVVEELHQRHVALRVAERDLMGRGKNARGVFLDGGRFRGDRGLAVGGRAGAIEALRRFLATVFRDSTDFVFDRARFDRDYAELERLVMEGRTLTEVVAVLHGLVISSPRLELGGGLTLVRADAGEPVPDGAAGALLERPGVIVRLEWEAAAGDEAEYFSGGMTVPGPPPKPTAVRLLPKMFFYSVRLK